MEIDEYLRPRAIYFLAYGETTAKFKKYYKRSFGWS